MANPLYLIFKTMDKVYGAQNWWPAEEPFEVMIGAILTQNTSWTNVEKALINLKQAKSLNCKSIANMRRASLAKLIRPSGYFNVKAERLKNFCQWYLKQQELEHVSDIELRNSLLSVKGIGPETADDILLYAYQRPVFVIDAYTRRLCVRLGYTPDNDDYESWRNWFESSLNRVKNKVAVFNQYHALIVHHAKYYCKAKQPHCRGCCLRSYCDYADE